MPNTIYTKQNETKFITYLAAQRQIYDDAKKLNNIWFILIVVIAFLGTDILESYQNLSEYIIIVVIIMMVFEVLIKLQVDSRKEIAAKIQELLDCELYELEWNDLIGTKPSQDEIEVAARRHLTREGDKKMKQLSNWYRDYSDFPLQQAILACQLENLGWDSKLRQQYAWFLTLICFGIVFLLGIIGLILAWDFRKFFSGPVFLTIPLVYELVKQIVVLIKVVSEQDKIRNNIESVLQMLISNKPSTNGKIQARIREIQTEIYRSRANSILVSSRFYWWKRKILQK